MKKTVKLLRFEEVRADGIEQIKMFIQMCKFAKVNGAMGGNGITKKMLYEKGMTDRVWQFLVSNHYCNEQQPGKPLWVAVNGNKLYPEQTIQNLEKKLEDFKQSEEYRSTEEEK